jgi:hypothetical protein
MVKHFYRVVDVDFKDEADLNLKTKGGKIIWVGKSVKGRKVKKDAFRLLVEFTTQ